MYLKIFFYPGGFCIAVFQRFASYKVCSFLARKILASQILVPNKEDVKSAFQLAKNLRPVFGHSPKGAVKQRQRCGDYPHQFSGTDRFGGLVALTTTHSTCCPGVPPTQVSWVIPAGWGPPDRKFACYKWITNPPP